MTAQLRSLAKRYTAAWCSQDAASVAAFYLPDGSLSLNGGPPAVGRGAITALAQGFMADFSDLKVMMDGLDAQGGARCLLLDTRGYQHRAGRDWETGSYQRLSRSGESVLTVSSLSHAATSTAQSINVNSNEPSADPSSLPQTP